MRSCTLPKASISSTRTSAGREGPCGHRSKEPAQGDGQAGALVHLLPMTRTRLTTHFNIPSNSTSSEKRTFGEA